MILLKIIKVPSTLHFTVILNPDTPNNHLGGFTKNTKNQALTPRDSDYTIQD